MLGPFIIGSALIWGLTIVGASLVLGDVESKTQALRLLSAGAGLHLILIWGPLAAVMKKLRDQLGDGHEDGE